MSASWDVDRESDSLLGLNEFSNNVKNVKEGLKRSRENAILREKMSSLGENELLLNRREGTERKRKQSLETKIKKELE
jgi:hypothetical protein